MSGFMGSRQKRAKLFGIRKMIEVGSPEISNIAISQFLNISISHFLSDDGNLDMFLEEEVEHFLRSFSCDLLLEFPFSFSSEESKTRRFNFLQEYTKPSDHCYSLLGRNENETLLFSVYRASKSVSIIWHCFGFSEVLLFGLVRLCSQIEYRLFSESEDSLSSGFWKKVDVQTESLTSHLKVHFNKCHLYCGELRFRGWALSSTFHRGTTWLRITRVSEKIGRGMFRNEPRIWHKSMKNPGILWLEDAEDLTTHNATITTELRNRIFNLAFQGFPESNRIFNHEWVEWMKKTGARVYEWVKIAEKGEERMRKSQRNGRPFLEENCKKIGRASCRERVYIAV
jgi:hypothetical protein